MRLDKGNMALSGIERAQRRLFWARQSFITVVKVAREALSSLSVRYNKRSVAARLHEAFFRDFVSHGPFRRIVVFLQGGIAN